MIAEVLNSLAAGTGTDLRPLQVKLACVGPQSKSLPAIAFTTFHHLLVPDWFIDLQTPELPGGECPLWNFTVTPEEMSRVVKELARPGIVPEKSERNSPLLALLISLRNSRLGDMGFESLLTRGDGERVSKAIENALAPTNPLAMGVIRQQRSAVFT